MAIRFPCEGNPHYPLPPDYESLTPEGKKMARINAVRLQETAEDFVWAWDFFRTHYLKPRECGWYKRWRPSPPMHYAIIHDLAAYPRNIMAASRGFCKSTVVTEAVLTACIGRKNFWSSIIRATDKKSRKHMRMIRRQLMYNQRIIDDFGELRPARGDRMWNTDMLELPWGSTIESISIGGALRGDRPDFIGIDDPEYDEEDEGDSARVQRRLENFDIILFRIVEGMMSDATEVSDEGSSVGWIGTPMSASSYISRAVRDLHDPRFRFFNRRIFAALDAQGNSTWEARFSTDALRVKRQRMGEDAWQREMMCNPVAASTKLLKIHPHLCTYEVLGAPEKDDEPLQSVADMRYTVPVKTEGGVRYVARTEPFGPFVQRLFRVALVDVAYTQKTTSDYSCIMVLGFDPHDVLWVLDTYLDRPSPDQLYREIYNYCRKWRVKVCGVEDLATQSGLANIAQAHCYNRSIQDPRGGYLPQVMPIRYPGNPEKAQRIAAMEWRYSRHFIRFPVHRRHEFALGELFYQVENFSLDMSALDHDDAVDALAMHQYLLRHRGRFRPQRSPFWDPLKLLREGTTIDEDTNLPILPSVPTESLDQEVLQALKKKHYNVAEVNETLSGQAQADILKPTERPYRVLSWFG